MTDFPSNNSSNTSDELLADNLLTISKIVDRNGVSVVNRITYETAIEVSGINAEPKNKVLIMNGSEELGEANTDDFGNFKSLLLELKNYDCYNVRAVGAWPPNPSSLPKRFTAATATPKIQAVLAADGKPIADGDTISETSVTLHCDALPNQPAEARNGDDPLKTETATGCGKCTFELKDLQPGSYSITVKATNNNVSNPFRFIVIEEGVEPVTLDKVTNAGGTVIPEDSTTPENDLFVEGEGEKGAKVEGFKNGVTLGEVDVDATTGRYRIPTGLLPDDTYAFTATAKYAGGGTAGPYTITVESIKKQVTLDKLTNAAGTVIPEDSTTPENDLFVEGEGEKGAKVEGFKNGVTLGEVDVDATTGRYRIPTGLLPDDTYAFTVTAKYAGGGTAGPYTITVEAATTEPAPTETRIYDVDGNVNPDGDPINKSWFIARGNHLPKSAVKIKINGVIQPTPEPTDSNGRWVYFQNNLIVGTTYEISALTLDEKAESNKWRVVAGTPSP